MEQLSWAKIKRSLGKKDPALIELLKRVGSHPSFPLPSQKRLSYYRCLARAIVFQQLAYKAADTIHSRVCALTSGRLFPSEKALLQLSDASLREAGLSQAKILAVQDLARKSLSSELKLRSLGRLSNAEVVGHLIQVRGIGEWTAQMFLMFRLGRLDILPCGDLGVQEGLRLLDGKLDRPKPKELEARGERWAPYRSVAAWSLWRLVDEQKA